MVWFICKDIAIYFNLTCTIKLCSHLKILHVLKFDIRQCIFKIYNIKKLHNGITIIARMVWFVFICEDITISSKVVIITELRSHLEILHMFLILALVNVS